MVQELPKFVDYKFFLIFAIICSLIFLFYFPSFWASIDEHGYVKNAVLLTQGKIGVAEPEYACRASVFNGQEYISSRFIGKSIFLIPFTFFGLQGVMLSGLVIHLINFFVILLILKKLNIRKEFSILYLFLPTFVWASRTIYPGLLVLTCFLISLYFYLSEKKHFWAISGLFAGLAVFARYDSVVAVFAIVIALLLFNRKKLLYFAAPLVPIAILVLIVNSILYGGALTTGSGSSIDFISRFLVLQPVDLAVYAIILLVYLPLLLASPLLENRTGLRKELILFSIAYLIFNSIFTSFFAFDFEVSAIFTSRLRYLVPLIGVLLIPYFSFLDSLADRIEIIKKNFNKIFLFSAAAAVIATLLISSIHYDFLNESRKGVFDIIYANTEENSLIIGSSDDCMYFIRGFFPNRKYLCIDLNQDIALNPQNVSTKEEIVANKPSYIMILSYSYLSGRTSGRAELVRGERKKIVDFYEINKTSFDLVVENREKGLGIYRHNLGEINEG